MAELTKKRRRRDPVDLPERKCAYPTCEVVFKPIRRTQRFHTTACKKAHWAEAYHWTPHPCPLCTVVHDPGEKPMLDALEHWIADNSMPGTGGSYDQLWAQDLKTWVAARRATLHG